MEKMCGVFLLVCLILTSCAQMGGSSGEEVIGAGTGVVVGALAGQLLGKDTKSTLAGAVAGGLLGYAIGWKIKTQTKQIYDQRQTQKLIPVKNSKKRIVHIQRTSIEPSNQLKRGENVTVRVTYIIMDPVQPQVPVSARKTLWLNSCQIAVLEESMENRENGTWESFITFQVPDNAEKGAYVVRQDVTSGPATKCSLVNFTVI